MEARIAPTNSRAPAPAPATTSARRSGPVRAEPGAPVAGSPAGPPPPPRVSTYRADGGVASRRADCAAGGVARSPGSMPAMAASYRRGPGAHDRLRRVSHPSLGLPPRDLSAGDTAAAAAIRSGGPRLRARAFAAALDIDPTLRDRHDELVRDALVADLEAFTDRLIIAVASDDPGAMATFADLVAVRYRKRKIAMDDVVTLCEGLRRAAAAAVQPDSPAGRRCRHRCGDRRVPLAPPARGRRPEAQRAALVHLQGRVT